MAGLDGGGDDSFEDDIDGEEFCDDTFEDDDESEGEEFCDDGDDGEEFCDDPGEDEDDGEDFCEDPSEDEDDGEEFCEDPCDDEDNGEGAGEEFCDDPCDDDEDEEGEREELCDDEDDWEGELCDSPCGVDGGPCRDDVGGEGFCVSGFSFPDGSDLSDTLEDNSEEEEEEEEGEEEGAAGFDDRGEGLVPNGLDLEPPLLIGGSRMVSGADYTDTDSDSDSYSDDADSDTADFIEVLSSGTRPLPASQATVDGLPEATLSEEEASCGCTVCKDGFAPGQSVVRLPCKHFFHGDCIRPWLAIRNTCPVCRYQLPTDDAQARHVTVLVPAARQDVPAQSGGGSGGDGASIVSGDAAECPAENGPEQSAS